MTQVAAPTTEQTAAQTSNSGVSAQESKRPRPSLARKIYLREQIMAVLNGNSIAIIIAVIPAALLTQLLQALPQNTVTTTLLFMVGAAQCALPLLAGIAVGNILKLTYLESGSIGLATVVSAGNIHIMEKGFSMNGPGVILNILLVSFLAVFFTRLWLKCLGQMKIIFLPLFVMVTAGGIGLITLPYMSTVQTVIGQAANAATTFTPLVMGVILAVLFAFIVCSPLSSAAVGTAIGLTGIAAATSNVGVATAGFTLAFMGASVNPLGGTITHFMGSPKIQMANLFSRPKLFVPVFIAAGIAGFMVALLQLEGTPFSSGFGLAGFIGPVTAFQVTPGGYLALRVLSGFIFIPAAVGFLMKVLFIDILKVIKAEELKLPDV